MKKKLNGEMIRETQSLEHSIVGHGSSMLWAPGDSGALVYTGDGYFVSLIFVGCEATGVGYFAHVDDLFAYIKESTGAAGMRVKQ